MVAVLGLDNTGVTGLAGGVEAPVVEGGDRLAGVDVLVQTAVLLGAGVVGVLGGQLSEGLLALLALLESGQDGGSGVLSDLLLVLGVGGGAGGLVGGAALEGDQDVADVDQLGQVVVLALNRTT